MNKRILLLVMCVGTFLFAGCSYTHSVHMVRPERQHYATKTDQTVYFFMEKAQKEKSVTVRSFSVGFAHQWDSKIGEAVLTAATPHIEPAVKKFIIIDDKNRAPQDALLVQPVIEHYTVENFRARLSLRFTVSKADQIIFQESYTEAGSSGAGRSLMIGTIAMNSAIRKSTYVAINKAYKAFVKDLRNIGAD